MGTQAEAQNCRLRSANRGNANNTWNVNTTGNVNNNNATNANRPVPDCVKTWRTNKHSHKLCVHRLVTQGAEIPARLGKTTAL